MKPFALLAAALLAVTADAADRPNVLVILADDLGFSDLSCYGSEIATPNLDRLASGGAKFSAFYNSARCCPSRASLVTGLHPHEAGIGSFTTREPRKNSSPAYTGHLLPNTATVAEILGDAGYSTWMVGKWHMGDPGPIERGFQNYYGYKNFQAHSENQWDPDLYVRLPQGTKPEVLVPGDEFYVTDVFSDYALEFLRQARTGENKEKPWLLYLAHSSPHFPIQAPKESIDRHVDTYRRGWDALRSERFERQKKLGLVSADAELPPRAQVPVDREDIANGFSGKPNPAWDSLPADRREDLARRMATFAAMVEHVDQGIGRIIADLEKNGELDNTLIFFTSDNGACYEWGPFGFDEHSRRGITTLHTGAALAKMGQDGTHHSYGSAWANLGNTPLDMYKHFCHEGGIASPLIVHWPNGLKKQDGFVTEPSHIMDIVPSICEATGAAYPEKRKGTEIQPVSGVSILGAAAGKPLAVRSIPIEHQQARGLRRGDWKIVWGKRQPEEVRWELYNLAHDRSEQHDLAAEKPEILNELVAEWETWARKVGAEPFDKPKKEATAAPETSLIVNRPLSIIAEIKGGRPHGVILSQGGVEHGIALHLIEGRPAFDVRVDGKVTRLACKKPVKGNTRIVAKLDPATMTLAVDGGESVTMRSPGLIPHQPKDPLCIGEDTLTSAGDYPAPNRFTGGTIVTATVEEGAPVAAAEVAAPNNGKATSAMMTEWGEKLKPEDAWTEYPRPAFARKQWTNLNGLWKYAVAPKNSNAAPSKWQGDILVPFAIESSLSGVGKRITPQDAIWYRRSFEADKLANGQRKLLNFEAVDYHSTVWVNDTMVGEHIGGNLPFSFDITDALKPGKNELTVKVTDATDTAFQLHGKQVSKPGGIWYTPVSGIWQTVWMETVPEKHLVSHKVTTTIDGNIRFAFDTEGDAGDTMVEIKVSLDGKAIAATTGTAKQAGVRIPDPILWSPDSPTLYDVELRFGDDVVHSYVGIRESTVAKDDKGHLRFLLNGKPIFHWGTLDQGWWPDGLLTPPSDEAMVSDIEFLKTAGFNTIRKHIKVEPRRYYYHCDRLGMMMWQDQVSSGTGKQRDGHVSPKWTRLQPNPSDAKWPDADHSQYMKELGIMIDTLQPHPCIVQWVPFNEAWGQHRTEVVGKWTVAYDPTRQVNVASGGNFFPVGHIIDHHQYPHPGFPFELGEGGRFDNFVKVVGEFGGHGFPVKGHLWDVKARNWGYGGLPKNKEEWIERYKTSISMLADLRNKGIAAGIYTQTTDVEGEINGLITYDRKVRKLAPEALAEIHRKAGITGDPETAGMAPVAIPTAKVAPVAPAMPRAEIEAGLRSHDRALYIKEGWIRDPYITLGPDDFFYLTGTTINDEDPREETDPYNIGLSGTSAVGNTVRVWRSKDLIDWDYLGTPFTLKDSAHPKPGDRVWAPEMHWIPEMDRWALVHCPKQKSNLMLSAGPELRGPWSSPMGRKFAGHHDPSLFHDGDRWWVLSENTRVTPISSDFSKFTGKPVRIDPSGSRPGPDGNPISRIGHEGATMLKIGDKYVHLGTAWSTDKGRQGSYNLYYCVADKITGPYGPRKFAGRFLGHGTPFQTRDGKWWCTAFFNANVPPLPRDGIESRDLAETAQTINQRGTTIVPLDVRVLDDGDIFIRAKDPAYATPGPDEVQKFPH
ncbi:glycosylhydrolase family 43 [Haloferula helveola]|uniref:Glycosylhydrolase family 43 n=1 Tax=Haloferula helveola TaxID=490095 RepID=A0ABM7RCU5_9BACT|nr:glycosylhydrolase family 43 [Haloferula helveola]